MCQPATIAASEMQPLEEPVCAACCQKTTAFPQTTFGAYLRNTMVKKCQWSFFTDTLAAGAALLLAQQWKIWWEGEKKKKKTMWKKTFCYPRASMRCKLFGFVPCESVPLFNFQRLMCPSSSKHRFLVDSKGQQKSAADAWCGSVQTAQSFTGWNEILQKEGNTSLKTRTCLKPPTIHRMYGQSVPIKASAF